MKKTLLSLGIILSLGVLSNPIRMPQASVKYASCFAGKKGNIASNIKIDGYDLRINGSVEIKNKKSTRTSEWDAYVQEVSSNCADLFRNVSYKFGADGEYDMIASGSFSALKDEAYVAKSKKYDQACIGIYYYDSKR